MARLEVLKFGPRYSQHDRGRGLDFSRHRDCAEERGGDDQAFCPGICHDVVNVRMQGDRHVGWDRPWGGRPDNDEEWFVSWQAEFCRFGGWDRKFYPNRNRGMIFIFNLSFR